MTYAQARAEIARRVEQAKSRSEIKLDDRRFELAFETGVLTEIAAALLLERNDFDRGAGQGRKLRQRTEAKDL